MQKELDLVTIQVSRDEARMISTALSSRGVVFAIEYLKEGIDSQDRLAKSYSELSKKVQAQKVAQFEVAEV